ncbi:N-acetylmuramoyl-L-alanine amidase [uncultured Granulicatella sp.]|jgi:N-acetylmuramoyl-L-alanine amidase, family 3|uniref:N-acetylmuramoyl-L-alanine amidase n=1 Tax=uncultured Granulicatella sp. TaxID=316089 RepID=UPI0028E66754|nr:N-acetylmuramoyl-L-alanine amidase [uncultured Granulicatella sp.]
MKKKIFLSTLLIGTCLCASTPIFAQETTNAPQQEQKENKKNTEVPTPPKEEVIKNQWKQVGNHWYYYNEQGVMLKNTVWNSYYFHKDGKMANNEWIYQNNHWYYAKSSGILALNEWMSINQRWYVFNPQGIMLANQWKDEYYLKSSGAMAENEWVFDPTYQSWFYLTSSGRYAQNTWKDDYYLKSGGYMAKKEWIYDSNYQAWFYLDENGVYVTGSHLINGALHSFKGNGAWIKEIKEEKSSDELPFATNNYQKVIFLDPGHGGKDPGAQYLGLKEKDLNLQVSQQLKTKLESLGYKVIMSRSSDVYLDFITERSRMSNETNADMFISIHFNATGHGLDSGEDGIQTYTYLPTGNIPSVINKKWHDNPTRLKYSYKLGSYIHQSVLATTQAKDAGLLAKSFAVLRETNKPAVLLELGYMDDSKESQKIRTKEYQQKLVDGIVQGIQQYYNN